jgi:pimeloyl-ACP methyl ester carboxylesterase
VHGWTCDRSFFAPQAEHFARRHRVVSVDLRGHGESDKPHGAYPVAAYADELVRAAAATLDHHPRFWNLYYGKQWPQTICL